MNDINKPAEPELNWDELRPQLIKFSLELGPLLVFFLGNLFGERLNKSLLAFAGFDDPIYPATILFMIAMVAAIALSAIFLRKVAVMPLVTAVIVLIFGGLTIAFHDPMFIKIKPTITNSFFGLVLLGGLLFKQSLLKFVFGDVYKLQPQGWFILTVRWGLFFLLLAVINEVLWRNFSADVWLAFKVWGVMPLTILFSIAQLPVLSKYAPPAEPAHIPPIVVDL
ncbi:septation protein A [Devosia sp.]|uniref:septation protein A n=1 Tax=Devosia sp. TaxID=1871048 RepID=UPI0032653694